jgi:hypothetical protein
LLSLDKERWQVELDDMRTYLSTLGGEIGDILGDTASRIKKGIAIGI